MLHLLITHTYVHKKLIELDGSKSVHMNTAQKDHKKEAIYRGMEVVDDFHS